MSHLLGRRFFSTFLFFNFIINLALLASSSFRFVFTVCLGFFFCSSMCNVCDHSDTVARTRSYSAPYLLSLVYGHIFFLFSSITFFLQDIERVRILPLYKLPILSTVSLFLPSTTCYVIVTISSYRIPGFFLPMSCVQAFCRYISHTYFYYTNCLLLQRCDGQGFWGQQQRLQFYKGNKLRLPTTITGFAGIDHWCRSQSPPLPSNHQKRLGTR